MKVPNAYIRLVPGADPTFALPKHESDKPQLNSQSSVTCSRPVEEVKATPDMSRSTSKLEVDELSFGVEPSIGSSLTGNITSVAIQPINQQHKCIRRDPKRRVKKETHISDSRRGSLQSRSLDKGNRASLLPNTFILRMKGLELRRGICGGQQFHPCSYAIASQSSNVENVYDVRSLVLSVLSCYLSMIDWKVLWARMLPPARSLRIRLCVTTRTKTPASLKVTR